MSEQIKDTERFKKWNTYLEKGKKMQENNPLESFKVFQKWVIKEVSSRESVNLLQNLSYCSLGQAGIKVKVGFLVANKVPFGCREATDEEILQIDAHRRANNIQPFPLEEIPLKKIPQKLGV